MTVCGLKPRHTAADSQGVDAISRPYPDQKDDLVERFTRMCGATVPMRLQLAMERVRHDAQAVTQLGVAHAVVQCMELLQRSVPGIHFYTLNRSPASRMIVSALRARTG